MTVENMVDVHTCIVANTFEVTSGLVEKCCEARRLSGHWTSVVRGLESGGYEVVVSRRRVLLPKMSCHK